MCARFAVTVAALFLVVHATFGHPVRQIGPLKIPSGSQGAASAVTTQRAVYREKSWFGKVDLVEKTRGRSVRFFERADGLSLFARGDFKAILLGGYFAKAHMSIGYHAIACPGGITGTCGFVNFVSVDQGNNF